MRRLGFASTVMALLLLVILPGTTAAASYNYQVKSNTCKATGGYYGYGHLFFKVQINEYGNSGANRFAFAAKVMDKDIYSSRWHTDWNAGTYNYYFPDSSSSYWYVYWWSYDPGNFAFHRFKVVLKVYDGSFLLASKTLYGKTC